MFHQIPAPLESNMRAGVVVSKANLLWLLGPPIPCSTDTFHLENTDVGGHCDTSLRRLLACTSRTDHQTDNISFVSWTFHLTSGTGNFPASTHFLHPLRLTKRYYLFITPSLCFWPIRIGAFWRSGKYRHLLAESLVIHPSWCIHLPFLATSPSSRRWRFTVLWLRPTFLPHLW